MDNAKRCINVFADQYEKDLGDLFGVFFEDISHSADGGLYAELVQNRSFEFDPIDNPEYHSLYAWNKVQRGRSNVEIHVETTHPLNHNNLHYLVLEVLRVGNGAGVQNMGFNTGIPLKKGKTYRFSCFYHRISSFLTPLLIRLENKDGSKCFGESSFIPDKTEWTKIETEITCNGDDNCGRLTILAPDKITVAFDMISLFPTDTYKNRENGLRKDLANLIADMKPKFMRFPGGCLSHYGSINSEDRNSMYRWKNTLGPLEKRPTRRNPCNYNQTLGLGFYELFQFCEDIGATPLPVIAAGYDPHTLRAVPLDEIQPWIDEALDLIEFANGDIKTKWGAIRAELGHPSPFQLKYIGIGNEEIGQGFFDRFEIIHRAIKEKYPDIFVIGSAGPGSAGGEFIRAWEHAKKVNPDYMDEHYYQAPEWFITNIHRYDNYPTNGPKVFLGEYGSCDDTYFNALAEAAYMIAMEKAPMVGMACYAPMLCNTDYRNWTPNMILFNNHMSFGTASYQVQKLFMLYQGDKLLHAEGTGMESHPQAAKPITGEFGFETKEAHVDFSNIRVVNHDTGEVQKFRDVSISPKSPVSNVGTIGWENYAVTFLARKNDDDSGSNISGTRWFEMFYGKIGNNKRTWVLDWWMNLATNRCIVNNRMYELVSHRFFPEPGKVYSFRLEIKGRHIRTFIDNVPFADVEDAPAIIEELYYSASIDENMKSMFVKVVNLQEQDIESDIHIQGLQKNLQRATAYSLSGYLPDDRNSYQEPDKITPKETALCIKNHTLSYLFPKQSVTVLKLDV